MGLLAFSFPYHPHIVKTTFQTRRWFLIADRTKGVDNKNMKMRTVFFVILCGIIWSAESLYDNFVQPKVTTDVAMQAVNGNDMDAALLRTSQEVHNTAVVIPAALTLLAAGVCYGSVVKRKIQELA